MKLLNYRLLHIGSNVKSWLTGSMLLVALSQPNVMLAEEFVAASQSLTRIEAGTVVDDPNATHWNRVVLLARPRIASGDVDSLAATIRESVSSFVLTILASVAQATDPVSGEPRYTLEDVGVGYSMQVGGTQRVVTVAEAAKIGVNLSIVTRLLLSENEKQLETARIVARTSTFMIVDTPAFVLRGATHAEYVMRHFIWIDHRTGRNAALVWLIKTDKAGKSVIEDSEPLRWASAGLREDRAIHVDGTQFMLGIPNKRAFAIESLPPGKPIPWTEEAKSYAALDRFDDASLHHLSVALNATLQAAASRMAERAENSSSP